jgi:hypothetical protein
MINTPPDLCASATGAASVADNTHAATNPPGFDLIAYTSPQPLSSIQELQHHVFGWLLSYTAALL